MPQGARRIDGLGSGRPPQGQVRPRGLLSPPQGRLHGLTDVRRKRLDAELNNRLPARGPEDRPTLR